MAEERVFFKKLIPDWHDPKHEQYDLLNTMNSADSLELLEIAERKTYSVVCLRMFYQLFYESSPRIDDSHRVAHFFDIDKFSIQKVISMKNNKFKIDLLKLIVVHWKTYDDGIPKTKYDWNTADISCHSIIPHGYADVKQLILSNIDDSSKRFFNMAFYLHENLVNKFEFELEIYLEKLQSKFGNFHEYLVMKDLPLLLVIIKRKELLKTADFTIARCP